MARAKGFAGLIGIGGQSLLFNDVVTEIEARPSDFPHLSAEVNRAPSAESDDTTMEDSFDSRSVAEFALYPRVQLTIAERDSEN